MSKPRFSRQRWGIDWEISSNSIVYRSCKGELTVAKMYGGVVVFGEVRLGRWDGREPTIDQEFDWNVFRSADEPQERFSEITAGQIQKTFSGRGAYGQAKAWAGEQLVVVPVTVPFDVAKARNTGEGVRDWGKLLAVLAEVLYWDGKSSLPDEEVMRRLYNEHVLNA